MRVYTFTEGQHVPEGTEERPGKPEWPDAVVIELKRTALFRLLREIVGNIEHADAGEAVTITLHGALKEGES